jgi:type I restriction enzyme, S subunit
MPNWPIIKLGDATRRIGGGTPSRKEPSYWGGDLPWFTVADLEDIDDIQELTTSREGITRKGLQKSAAKLVPAGSIVFSSRVVVGKVGIAKNELVTNQDFSSFVPINSLNNDFLAYYLLKVKIDLREHQRGATIKGVTTKVLDFIDVPHPPLSEQRRIVARIKECIERVEEIERLRAEAIAEVDYLAPSLYYAIEENNKWDRKKIGDLIVRSRNGRSIAQDSQNATGHVLSIRAVHDVTLDLSARKPIALSREIAAQYSIAVGDVFVSRSNTRELVGLASVATEKPDGVIYPDLLIKLELRQDIIRSRYLAYILRTPESRKQIKDRAVGTSQSMVKISGERLRDIEIPIPSLNIQDELILKFDELSSINSTLLGELRSLNSSELRQSILLKAFAGEL